VTLTGTVAPAAVPAAHAQSIICCGIGNGNSSDPF
jgi:hypothetical protein